MDVKLPPLIREAVGVQRTTYKVDVVSLQFPQTGIDGGYKALRSVPHVVYRDFRIGVTGPEVGRVLGRKN